MTTPPFEHADRALRGFLQLSASPIAIAFHDDVPATPARFDEPLAAPGPDGRTGTVPAGCVFWIHGADRSVTTVASDHANCSVGSYTHGFLALADAAGRDDVAAIVEAGWVAESDFAAIPAVSRRPTAVTYAPLSMAEHADVVLVRLHAAGLMTLMDAWPGLRIEGKPQCHIVALAASGEVAASVGCALSRARTGMPPTEATAAMPISELQTVLARLERAASANVIVARYAGADAQRFATAP